MKLIFLKNLKSNFICTSILNFLLLENQKTSSLSFMKEFKIICAQLNLDVTYAIENIVTILEKYKKNTLQYDETIDNELIKVCLENNTDPRMRNQLNLVTYAGPLILDV